MLMDFEYVDFGISIEQIKLICANGVVVRMEPKVDDGVNQGGGIQEDRSGGTQYETNETPIGDGRSDSCDEWVEGEATEYRDVLMLTEADMIRKKGPSAKGRDTPTVKDPVVVKTKGALRIKKMSGRKRRCSMCRKAGHAKRHCTGKRGLNVEADPQEDGKTADLGSEGSSPTENAKGRCDTLKVLSPKAGEAFAELDVEESGFRPKEGGQSGHIRTEGWDSVLPLCYNDDNCVKIEELMHDIIRVTERLSSNRRQV
ncbi:hypothetical protein AHAS_Ahas16G0096200 [Arachis hypogaea]